MLVLINESYFAERILEPLLRDHHDKIAAVIVSTRLRGSASRSAAIARKVSKKYLLYRLSVEFITRLRRWTAPREALNRARKLGVPIVGTPNVNSDPRVQEHLPAALGVMINFDQVLSPALLAQFTGGVLNLHSSRLPQGRGISPALWAFARGDTEIWASIYRVDNGLDTGPLYEQFAITVPAGATAFEVYERICREGGERLSEVVTQMYRGDLGNPVPQDEPSKPEMNSWPDRRFDALLKRSGRKLLAFRDLLNSIFRRE